MSIKDVIDSLSVHVGTAGCDPFPIVDKVWDLYGGKGIRTVFVTVGSSKSALADLEIAESLGCPLNIVTLNDAEKESWAEVTNILKERKRDDTASVFSEKADTKWILPKNIRLQESVPWWEKGTLDISGSTKSTESVDDFMKSICATMKLKDNISRMDILKIDTTLSKPGLEKGLLGAVMNAGYRPAIILVRWSDMPDVDLSTTLAAGHLQNCGYSLLSKLDNKFLYFFTNDDLYQICSWEGITGSNPISSEIIKAARAPISASRLAAPSEIKSSKE